MTIKEKNQLVNYFMHKEEVLADDYNTYEDRYRLRKCDELDHTGSIIALSRLKMFIELYNDISALLKL